MAPQFVFGLPTIGLNLQILSLWAPFLGMGTSFSFSRASLPSFRSVHFEVLLPLTFAPATTYRVRRAPQWPHRMCIRKLNMTLYRQTCRSSSS
ncbi:hypothetical protein QBC45DRAFT_414836 [Copromyces sp. CBS 386.78]|nr:hypothetical protein QBC45DRAFT_414836 [Copromyces sp. CBS 386.78]